MMGIPDVTEPELRRVADIACAPGETIWNMESVITPDVVYQAILGADAAGREYCARAGFKRISRSEWHEVLCIGLDANLFLSDVETRPAVSRSGTVNLIKDLNQLKLSQGSKS